MTDSATTSNDTTTSALGRVEALIKKALTDLEGLFHHDAAKSASDTLHDALLHVADGKVLASAAQLVATSAVASLATAEVQGLASAEVQGLASVEVAALITAQVTPLEVPTQAG